MSPTQTATQPSTNDIDTTAHHLFTGNDNSSEQDMQSNTMDPKAKQHHVDRTNPAIVSDDTTNGRSHKRSADQAFSASLSDDEGHSINPAKVAKLTTAAGKAGDSESSININERTMERLQQVDHEVMELEDVGNIGIQPLTAGSDKEVNQAVVSAFALDGTADDKGKSGASSKSANNLTHKSPKNSTGPEPTAFDAALANHALSALSILNRYNSPQTSGPLTLTFQAISATIGGATRIPARTSQADLVNALHDAQQGLEDLGTRKNQSISEMHGEQQELEAMGLHEEGMALMSAVTNIYRLLSTMREDYEALNIIKHEVRNLDEENFEDDEEMIYLGQQ